LVYIYIYSLNRDKVERIVFRRCCKELVHTRRATQEEEGEEEEEEVPY